LFDVEAETDNSRKQCECAYVSILEQQKARPDKYGAYDELRQCQCGVVYEQISEVTHWLDATSICALEHRFELA
jgi:hypothetical protein